MIYNFKNLVYLLSPYFKYGKLYMFLTIIIAAVIFPLSNILSVLFTQSVIDAIAKGETFSTVAKIILIYSVLLLILSLINNIFDAFYSEKKENEIQMNINKDICCYASKVDYKCFDDPDFYDNYTWTLKQFPAQAANARRILINICIACSTIVSMVSFISILSPWIILLVIVQMILFAVVEMKQNKINIKKHEELNPIDRRLDYNNMIFYGKEYAADIRCTFLKNFMLSDYQVNQDRKISIIKKYSKKMFGYTGLQNIIGKVYTISLMMMICYQFVVSKTIIGVGKFSSLLNASSQLSSSLYKIVGTIKAINASSLFVNKFREFQNASENSIESLSAPIAESTDFPYSVEFKNVCFGYPNSNFKLQNISMKVKKGEKVAIVGENGVGKTTLTKLLLRLYDCDSGEIFVNGIDIKNLEIKSLRQNIGVAFQSPHIYALSLIRNIHMYSEDPTGDVITVLNKVCLSTLLDKVGTDLNTELTKQFDKNGIELSGGEIQKISLARIFSQRFGLIILDEASSALDPNAEYEMNRIIFDASNESTTILIAHRLSSIKDADRIYVISDGGISECGTHSDLMKLKGKYFEMFNKQAEKYKD